MSDQDQQSSKEDAYSDEKISGSARLGRNEKKQLSNVKVIWVVGAPGSGKGTQIKKLAEKYNCSVFGIGDLVTKELSENTDIGMEIKSMMETGKTIPKDLINGWDLIIEATKIALTKKNDYIIFDLSKYLKPYDVILYPEIDDNTFETFEKYLKPCDVILNLEIDDNTMKTRMQQWAKIEGPLALYKEKIDLILKEAEKRNYKHVEIDATQSEDEVFNHICNEIEKLEDDNGEGTSTEEKDVVCDTAILPTNEEEAIMDKMLTELNVINSKLDLMNSKLDLMNFALNPSNNKNPDPMEEKNNVE